MRSETYLTQNCYAFAFQTRQVSPMMSTHQAPRGSSPKIRAIRWLFTDPCVLFCVSLLRKDIEEVHQIDGSIRLLGIPSCYHFLSFFSF